MISYTAIQTIVQLLRMIFDVLILWILLYYTIKIVRNNSRTTQIFKGIVLILLIKASASFFGLTTVAWLAGIFVTWGFLAVIIIFQPEIRALLEKLGKSTIFSRISTLSGNERAKLLDTLVHATMQLSESQTGALITLEQGHSLSDYIKTGTLLNSIVTSELLTSIFVTSTPLHDGAVIIQGDRIACASAYFPPTNLDLPTRYGARHRAAIGISEITDSITIVVSEESGRVSIAEEGKLTTMTEETLRNYLEKIILHEETEVHEFRSITKDLFKSPKPIAIKPVAVSDESVKIVPEAIVIKAKTSGLKQFFKRKEKPKKVNGSKPTQTTELPVTEKEAEPVDIKLENSVSADINFESEFPAYEKMVKEEADTLQSEVIAEIEVAEKAATVEEPMAGEAVKVKVTKPSKVKAVNNASVDEVSNSDTLFTPDDDQNKGGKQ